MTTVVLGLDGAGFELLNRWLGEPLANLQRIRDDGISADLRPCYPPVTCPNWQCYSKSLNPGKLGVFWWEKVDPTNREIRNASASSDFSGDFFWDYLDGSRVVLNLPTSFPPRKTNGVHVAGGPGAEQTEYTSPPEFESDLETDYGYKVHPEQLSLLEKEEPYNDCIGEIQDLIDTRFDVLLDQVQSGDHEFIHMSIFYINMLQHFYYDHEVVRETWEVIDNRVGDLLSADEIDNIFIMSDHGSNQVETWFRINSWLEQEGYLVRERGVSDILSIIGLTRSRVRSLLGTLGIEWWARQLVPERFQRLLPDSEGIVDRSAKAELLDWDESKAVASGQGPVYVLSSDPDERATIRDELIDKLSGLRSPDGTVVVENAHRSEEIYDGPHVDTGPDLILDQGVGVHIDGGIGSETVFDEPRKWNGENTMRGVFMAHGSDISNTFDRKKIHITDIGPTILHLHDCAIPEQMDGEILTDIFAAGSSAAQRIPDISSETQPTITNQTVTHENSDVSDRLESLGYLE